MFGRLFIGLIAFVFFTVQANAVSHNSLKSVFDKLNYELTVNYDGKNKAVYDAAVKKFNDQIKILETQGLTRVELTQYALTQIKDQKLASEVRAALTMIGLQKLSDAEASKILSGIAAKTRANGASWNGSAGMVVIIGAIIGLMAIMIYVAQCKGQEVYAGSFYTCWDVCDTNYDGTHTYCHEECGYEDKYDCINSTTTAN